MALLGLPQGCGEEGPGKLGKNASRFFGVEFSVGERRSWLLYGVEFSWFLTDLLP